MARATETFRKVVLAALAVSALAAAPAMSAHADQLQIETPQASPTDMPMRGMTMDKVQSHFGTPSQKLAAVGQPPITRWEYPSYIVYFEYDHVIHSVVKRPLA
jgi:hypothetical protein